MSGLASVALGLLGLSFVPLQSLLEFEYVYGIFIEGLIEVFGNEGSNPSKNKNKGYIVGDDSHVSFINLLIIYFR